MPAARRRPLGAIRGRAGWKRRMEDFMRKGGIGAAAIAMSLAWSAPGQGAPLSIRDSFRIGTGGSSYCSAQPVTTDPVLTGMFDVGYSITCRDAALAVGKLYKLRSGGDESGRLARNRAGKTSCEPPRPGSIEGLGSVETIECKLSDADVGYRVYQYRKGNQLFSVEGLAGYDSALRLALRSLVADKPVDGEVSIATTGAGDPASFARVQAGTLDPTRALAEAYRRNNVGNYADAAEFFAAVGSAGDSAGAPISRSEALINEALQKSNLGRYVRPTPCFPAPRSRCPATLSAAGGFETIGLSTCSTRGGRRMPSRNWKSRFRNSPQNETVPATPASRSTR